VKARLLPRRLAFSDNARTYGFLLKGNWRLFLFLPRPALRVATTMLIVAGLRPVLPFRHRGILFWALRRITLPGAYCQVNRAELT
jgi:hypothetical protein